MHDIYRLASERTGRGEPVVIATVVRVIGSAYRREGAKMMFAAGGRMTGTVSGGCLEGELAEVSEEVLAAGGPRLLHFDMTTDDDLVWGLGLGCNGIIDIFLERLDPGVDLLQRVGACLDRRDQVLGVATVVRSDADDIQAGTRFYLAPPPGADSPAPGATAAGDTISGTDALPAWLAATAAAELARRLTAGRHGTVTYLPVSDHGQLTAEAVPRPQLNLWLRTAGVPIENRDVPAPAGSVDVYFEALQPRPRLIVFGAGHDALPLVRFAADMGYAVTVVDSRRAFATRERFPQAEEIVCCQPDEAGDRVQQDPYTSVLVMTHHFLHDQAILRHVLPSRASYVGILGPRRRTDHLLKGLKEAGLPVESLDTERVRAPVGLDIGSETPEEIAVSILAELTAYHRSREGGPLRGRQGPIHARPEGG